MEKKRTLRTGQQCVSVSFDELIQLSKYAGQISLSALRVKSLQSGRQISPLLGRGMEFEQSRRYQSGDDIRHIDWKITARTGKAHTKLFSAEKERKILLCGDFRSSMFFATQGIFKSVQASLIMAYLAWSASKIGDKLGGVLFNDAEHWEFQPIRGKRGVLPFLQGVSERAYFPPKKMEEKSVSVINNSLEGILRVASPGSLVFVVSDFRRFDNHSRELLIQLSRHSDVCLCHIFDTLEASWPKKGIFSVGQKEKTLQLDTTSGRKLEKYHQQFLEKKEYLKSMGEFGRIHLLECSTQDDGLEIIKQHFN